MWISIINFFVLFFYLGSFIILPNLCLLQHKSCTEAFKIPITWPTQRLHVFISDTMSWTKATRWLITILKQRDLDTLVLIWYRDETESIVKQRQDQLNLNSKYILNINNGVVLTVATQHHRGNHNSQSTGTIS